MSEWKETDLGKIPIDWDLKTIDEIKSPERKSIISGPFGSNISAKYFVNEGVPVIRGNKLSLDLHDKFLDKDFVFISEEKANELNTWAIKDDLIFTAVGTIGQVGILRGKEKYSKYIISNKQLRLTVDQNIVEPLYAYYWFASPMMTDIILQRNTGSSVPLINLSILKSLLIPLPPEKERIHILNILSSLDDKIDLLHRQNATLEAMAETIFRQWFVEEAREEWEDGVLGDAIEIFDHLRIPLSKLERDKKKDGQLFPYYGAAQIMDYINEYLFDGEYILLGEDGTVRTEDGYPVLQYATGKFWVNNHTHVLKAKKPYNNYFIWNYLKKKNIDEIVTGAVQPKINQGNLKALAFSKFPTKLVEDFNMLTASYFNKIIQNKNQIPILTTLRDTLLPKLMSGEIKAKF
jgi:type I restriction enzyme S subunit